MYRNASLFLILGLLLLYAAASDQSVNYVQLEQKVIQERLKKYVGGSIKREASMKEMFEEAGCREGRLEEQPVAKTAAPNVICTLPGESDERIVVGAHFDHVSGVDGVADNWSGASLLPSLYQSLSAKTRRHTFVFIGFTDEEKGIVGSKFYSAGLTKDEAARVRAMVNMDTLGLGPTEVWASTSDRGLVRLMFDVASAMKLPVSVMNVDGYGNSDGKFFRSRGIPIITLHSVTKQTIPILHSRRDNLAAIQFDDYYDTYKLIAGYLAALDEVPARGPALSPTP
jgi:putative aminopeptidase FrvX